MYYEAADRHVHPYDIVVAETGAAPGAVIQSDRGEKAAT
jgi:hypothetical protein